MRGRAARGGKYSALTRCQSTFMRKILPVLIVGGAVWAWSRMHGSGPAPDSEGQELLSLLASEPKSQTVSFKCDGRQYCSQMSSCAEAKYFLRNCLNVKMDGNNDGVPCEMQWCGSR